MSSAFQNTNVLDEYRAIHNSPHGLKWHRAQKHYIHWVSLCKLVSICRSHFQDSASKYIGWAPDLREYPLQFGRQVVDLYDSLTSTPRGFPPPVCHTPAAVDSFQALPDGTAGSLGLSHADLESVFNYLRRGKHLAIPERWRHLIPKPFEATKTSTWVGIYRWSAATSARSFRNINCWCPGHLRETQKINDIYPSKVIFDLGLPPSNGVFSGVIAFLTVCGIPRM